jgi:hypothetical protein
MMEAPLLCGLPLARLDPELAVPTSDPARSGPAVRGAAARSSSTSRARATAASCARGRSALLPDRAPDVLADAVILGGRRPARASSTSRARAAGSHGLRARSATRTPRRLDAAEEGLEFFTGSRRHIESYLLVPSAIRARSSLPRSDHRLEAVLERELPDARRPRGWRAFDAKRLLAETGPLARLLGRPLPLARIARATREDELHADVHDMFGRLRAARPRRAPQAARSAEASAAR